MKKEQYILDPQESEQALTMIKSYLKPRELNHLTIGKEKIEGETCCAVTFGMFLNEKEYKRLKKFAKSVDVFKAAEDDFCEECSGDDAPTIDDESDVDYNMETVMQDMKKLQNLKEIKIPSTGKPALIIKL